MAAIPVRSHAITALVAMSIFWCGAIAGMLILHSTSATEPTTSVPAPTVTAALPTAAPTTTVRVVTVRSALPVEKVTSPSSTFEDRWSARESERASSGPIADSRAQLATSEPKPAAPEQPQDKVCGGRGRNYFYIGNHKYWHCRRR
jgi:hypothetical protein